MNNLRVCPVSRVGTETPSEVAATDGIGLATTWNLRMDCGARDGGDSVDVSCRVDVSCSVDVSCRVVNVGREQRHVSMYVIRRQGIMDCRKTEAAGSRAGAV